MKLTLLSTVSVLALVCGARAADMPIKARPLAAPAFTWTGFYAGVQVGAVAHHGTMDDPEGYTTSDNGARRFKADDTGPIGGVNAGYNLQTGSWVLGLEGDLNGLGAKAVSATVTPPNTVAFTTSFDVRWLATLRGRLGWTDGANLFYLTGGLAVGEVKDFAQFLTIPGPTPFAVSKVRTGWTIGGGIERMFGPHWSGRAEVRYVDLGTASATCPQPTVCTSNVTYRGEFSHTLLMGILGIDYRF